MLEWIAYHRALGVEHFVIGDNGGSDLTSELLLALDAAGLIVRLDWRAEVAFPSASALPQSSGCVA